MLGDIQAAASAASCSDTEAALLPVMSGEQISKQAGSPLALIRGLGARKVELRKTFVFRGAES